MARSKGQKTITVSLSEKLLAAVDDARKDRSRSEYTREALAELLEAEGIVLPESVLDAPSRQGKGGQPTHKKPVDFKAIAKQQKISAYNFREANQAKVAEDVYTLPFLGEVAAGKKGGEEFAETMQVGRDYGKGHFVVRVSGDSMEPELASGDLIVVKGSDIYTPANGRICVVSDGAGSSVKKWNRRRGLFESLNPDYPDLEPTEDLVFQGYFVEKVQ